MLLPAMLRLLHTVLGRNMLVLLMLRSRWQGQQKQHMLQQSENVSPKSRFLLITAANT